MQLQNGMSGAEIAEKMLADNGIRDVRVISVAGQLTDHYNPVNKTVNLRGQYTIKGTPLRQLWQHMNVDMRYNMPWAING
jgi:Zn-dependent membrane protease YugP